MIKSDDITVLRPDCTPVETSLELKMSTAWANLLEIVGVLCDALYVIPLKPRFLQQVINVSRQEWCPDYQAQGCLIGPQLPRLVHKP